MDSSAAPQNQPLIILVDPAAFADILEVSSKPHLTLQTNEKKTKFLLKTVSKNGEGIKMDG